MPNRIGVCSWSVTRSSPRDLVDRLDEVGLRLVQLALDPIRTGQWDEDETRRALDSGGITIASGMMAMAGEDYSTLDSIRLTGGVRPDEHWEANLGAARANADIAVRLGIELVTFHAGFLPHEPGNALRATMIQRLGWIADAFADRGVAVALETGQERAETLMVVLDELGRPDVGVNFDPGNMILYAMGDPVAALERLAPRVRQIHVKDALTASEPGTWGREVRIGDGGVDWAAFFAVIGRAGLGCDLVIEREAGADRAGDIRAAADLVRSYL